MPDQLPKRGNLFVTPANPTNEQQEVFEDLLRRPGIRVERIVSTGQTTPDDTWYDQPEDEWVALLQGEASLLLEDGTILCLSPGDYLLIPAHCKHRVTFTSIQPPAIWLAIFLTSSNP